MFHPVNSKTNFPQMEEKILAFWKANGIFKKSVDQRFGKKRFTLYEGPPTANGKPGIHHVLSRVFKDVMPRYKTMQGYYAPRVGGWDTHGLPVELEVERDLGFKSKTDIEQYGIAKFNEKCRASVFRYVKEWDALTERIGYWVDLENAYITMSNEYIESGWWVIKQLWDNGYIYQGHKVTPHCPRCGCSLSSHEVAQGYEENTEDPSVYVKFRMLPGSLKGRLAHLDDKPVYILAWTTTPWTLPANTALAVSACAEYSVVDLGTEYLVVASARLAPSGFSSSAVTGRLSGTELIGLKYQPLFDPRKYQIPISRMEKGTTVAAEEPEIMYPVISADYVSMEDGTGIVHTAPAYGELDYESGKKHGLYFLHPVDLAGIIRGNYTFSGKFVKSADQLIINDLMERDLIYKSETIRHTYPFCWRCGTPLLYFAKQSWYIRTTSKKETLISGNQMINWHPESIKNGRFGDWLQNNVDWAFSRERYWGTPVPIWRCEKCGATECIGSLDELESKAGSEGLSGLKRRDDCLDLHRPYIDEVSFNCSACGGRMKRVADVIDCWFDSGAMPVAQYHYPFNPDSEAILIDGRFPADYICEGIDQTRGWFYSLHALSTMLFDRPCYKNVICLGHILDEKGEKMSKSKGNVVLPQTVISKFGADAVRWYFYTASPAGQTRRFSESLVGEVTRQFLLTLWNTYSFLILYANIDKYNPASDLNLKPGAAALDRWLDSELNLVVKTCTQALDDYDPVTAARAIEEFVDSLSNWYVRRSRRRFWKGSMDDDKLNAYNMLYRTLMTLSRLLAPFMPFAAEELYQNLARSMDATAPESVHLTDWPSFDEGRIDVALSRSVKLAVKFSSIGRAARALAGIKVRQPLAEVLLWGIPQGEQAGLINLADQITEELNVKTLRFAATEAELATAGYSLAEEGPYKVAIDGRLSAELAAEGLVRELTHRLQGLRKSSGLEVADHIVIYFETGAETAKTIGDWHKYISAETLADAINIGLPATAVFKETFTLEGQEITVGLSRT